MQFIIPIIEDLSLSSAIFSFPAQLRGEFTQRARIKGSEQPPLTNPLFPTVLSSLILFCIFRRCHLIQFHWDFCLWMRGKFFPFCRELAGRSRIQYLTLTWHKWAKLPFIFFSFACQGRGEQPQNLGSWEESSGRALAAWLLGTAAWKAAGGSWEQHKCTESCPEQHKRWGRAFNHSHIPYLSPISPLGFTDSDNIQAPPAKPKCLTLHMVMGPAQSQERGKILALLHWRGFSHSSEWDQDFCSVSMG